MIPCDEHKNAFNNRAWSATAGYALITCPICYMRELEELLDKDGAIKVKQQHLISDLEERNAELLKHIGELAGIIEQYMIIDNDGYCIKCGHCGDDMCCGEDGLGYAAVCKGGIGCKYPDMLKETNKNY